MAFSIFKKQNQIQSADQPINNSHYNLEDPRFYYSEVVGPIVQEIITAVKSGLEVLNLEREWYYPIAIATWRENWEGIGAYFTLDFSVVKEEYPSDHEGWDIRGFSGWGNVGANIEIELAVSHNFDLTSFEDKCFSELTNVVAHEIHHLTQYRGPFERPGVSPYVEKRKTQTHFEYFTSRTEVPAFVIGLRAESAVTGRPMEYLATQYLLKQVAADLISENEKEKILSTWVGYSMWS